MDGSTFSKGDIYMILNLEMKPEIGVGKCCSYNQVLLILIDNIYSLITMTTHWVSGVIYGERVLCTSLVPILPLFYLLHYRYSMERLARMFSVFKKALYSLDKEIIVEFMEDDYEILISHELVAVKKEENRDTDKSIQVDIWAGRIQQDTTICPSNLNPEFMRYQDACSGHKIRRETISL
ncbi:18798_t:CDS:2 [Funneliformis geosporum]|uniref:18798_t:CDS:1 n=1 Tax=Funneliformis geosporum TaxID=1117311 RepID=A0A9W4WZ63_9GLOM|nr:18798_t:CDS:2 [Funneliformis geosporum]